MSLFLTLFFQLERKKVLRDLYKSLIYNALNNVAFISSLKRGSVFSLVAGAKIRNKAISFQQKQNSYQHSY